MFGLGVTEVIIILVVALLVFGPGRLPEIGGALGKGIRDFRRALSGHEDKPASELPERSETERKA